MSSITNTFRLLNNDEVLCELSSITYYDESNEFDEGETFYIHPITCSECQTLDQCFQGWREQNIEDQNNWYILADKIREDNDLNAKIFNMNIIEYYE